MAKKVALVFRTSIQYGAWLADCFSSNFPAIMFCFHIEPPPGFLDTLTQHLLLVYTGKTRLARNLLQV